MKLVLFLLFTTSLFSFAQKKGEPVTYLWGDKEMKGYLAAPAKAEGKQPGVLVVHEWWGHNDYARKRADMLAKLGYVALAVDMYGDGKTADHPKDAGKFSGEVMANMADMRARFEAAHTFLKKQEGVDPEKIGAIGYCFGGAVVLHMARSGADLDAVASFHGSLASKTRAEKGAVKAAVLVCHGADDGFIKPEDIDALKTEMKDAGADFEFVSYPNAVHGFTNPGATEKGEKFGIPLKYNKKADKQSWRKMRKLFETAFEIEPKAKAKKPKADADK